MFSTIRLHFKRSTNIIRVFQPHTRIEISYCKKYFSMDSIVFRMIYLNITYNVMFLPAFFLVLVLVSFTGTLLLTEVG